MDGALGFHGSEDELRDSSDNLKGTHPQSNLQAWLRLHHL